MYQYEFILAILVQCLETIPDTDMSEEERLSYVEGSLTTLTKYLESCRAAQQDTVKVIGGIWDGK